MVNQKKSKYTIVDSWTNQQIDRLESISRRMSDFINLGKYDLIDDLDRLRKKIILDITKKKIDFSDSNKKNILKIVTCNKKMIDCLRDKKISELKKIKSQKKCTEAYLRNT